MPFRVASVQFGPNKANLAVNLDTIAAHALQAASEGAELVVFPESATSGYILQGGVLECALTAETLAGELATRLKGLGRHLDLALGFYEQEGSILYNSAGYFEWDGSSCHVRHVYRKFFLPTYGVFDEERFVSAGRELGVFDTRLGRCGILICEDAWHSVLAMLLAVNGAELILVPSASPARGFSGKAPGNLERYERMLKAISDEHGVWCVNSMLTGFEGGKGFVGGSMVIDPFGQIVAQGPVQQEHMLLATIDLELVPVARAQLPLVADLKSAWSDIRRIVDATG